jgi:hypothetical protein
MFATYRILIHLSGLTDKWGGVHKPGKALLSQGFLGAYYSYQHTFHHSLLPGGPTGSDRGVQLKCLELSTSLIAYGVSILSESFSLENVQGKMFPVQLPAPQSVACGFFNHWSEPPLVLPTVPSILEFHISPFIQDIIVTSSRSLQPE